MNKADEFIDENKKTSVNKCIIEEKLRKDNKSAICSAFIMIVLFIIMCFSIYRVFIYSGRFLGFRLDSAYNMSKSEIKISRIGETMQYNDDINLTVNNFFENDEQITLNLTINHQSDDLYIYSPQQFVLSCADIDNNFKRFYSPIEKKRFPFLEKQSRKFTLTFNIEDKLSDYSLIIYNEDLDVIGKMTLNSE